MFQIKLLLLKICTFSHCVSVEETFISSKRKYISTGESFILTWQPPDISGGRQIEIYFSPVEIYISSHEKHISSIVIYILFVH